MKCNTIKLREKQISNQDIRPLDRLNIDDDLVEMVKKEMNVNKTRAKYLLSKILSFNNGK
jgi:hypothetical protein